LIKNEKYTGNALLQKKYVADHLTKRLVWNKGKLPMYFAEGTHPAIIDTATFERAQKVLKERRKLCGAKGDTHNRYPFSRIIRCENCGKKYKRKAGNRKPAWQCSTYLEQGKAACHAKQIPENILYEAATDVLGISKFDESIFKEKITEILVPEFNKLVFVFCEGHSVEKVWQDRSRRESWTGEMRQAAREKAKGVKEQWR
jgi:site-specific DNA recombinase